MIIADRGGHTQTSPGASDKLDELTEDRKLYKRVRELLAEVGNTMLDCTPPESYAYPSELSYGINKCNNSNAELFYSIHFNSFNGAYGSEICIYPGTDLTSKIGNKTLENLSDLGFRNRGLKPRTDLGELCNINCSSMIIEVCFVHEKDAAIYKSVGVEKIARAIANGIDSRVSLEIENKNTIVEEKKKVKNIVVYSNDIDRRAAEYLADYLSCPTISSRQNFDYTTVANIYAVGGSIGTYTAYLLEENFITGSDRYETLKAMLRFIDKL